MWRTSRRLRSSRRARSRSIRRRRAEPSRVLRLHSFQVRRHNAPRPNEHDLHFVSRKREQRRHRRVQACARKSDRPRRRSCPEPWAILEDGSNNLLALDGSGTVEIYSEATGKLVQQISVPNGAAWEAFNQKPVRGLLRFELRPSGSPELSRRFGAWIDQRGMEHLKLPDRPRLLATRAIVQVKRWDDDARGSQLGGAPVDLRQKYSRNRCDRNRLVIIEGRIEHVLPDVDLDQLLSNTTKRQAPDSHKPVGARGK